MFWMLVLGGCWWVPPEGTSASGMAGRVLGPDGVPLVGQLVETVESTVQTDADGTFGLYYKRPDTHVHFIHEGTWYRRMYLPADDGRVVTLQLPESGPRSLVCGEQACDVELKWELSPGFSGKQRARCEPGRTVELPSAPLGSPEPTCRVGGKAIPVVLRAEGPRLELGPPPRALTLSLDLDGTPAEPCVVRVDGTESRVEGDSVQVEGVPGAQVGAVCDGRPAWPARIPVDGDLVLRWTADGPSIQPPPGFAGRSLRLVLADGPLSVRATGSGSFLLPPLPAGTYRVELGSIPEGAQAPDPVDGVVVAASVGEGLVGTLHLSAPLDEGVVSVRTP